jgi:hypothetical protein
VFVYIPVCLLKEVLFKGEHTHEVACKIVGFYSISSTSAGILSSSHPFFLIFNSHFINNAYTVAVRRISKPCYVPVTVLVWSIWTGWIHVWTENQLTPWNKVVFMKHIVTHLVKICAFYGTMWFIAMLTRTHQWFFILSQMIPLHNLPS